MKFDPLVKSESNKLFRLSDGAQINLSNLKTVSLKDAVSEKAEIPSDKNTVTAVNVSWNEIEISDGNYNEEVLASLREYLKKLEENQCFAFIAPSAGKSFNDADQADSFIKAMVHCARRIKDAQSVIGFALAPELLEKDKNSSLDENSWSQWFVNEMNVKHGHYVYFASNAEIQKNELSAVISKTNYILY